VPLYTFLHNLPNVLVQIVNKIVLQKKLPEPLIPGLDFCKGIGVRVAFSCCLRYELGRSHEWRCIGHQILLIGLQGRRHHFMPPCLCRRTASGDKLDHSCGIIGMRVCQSRNFWFTGSSISLFPLHWKFLLRVVCLSTATS
jgi:hypothetical protein